MIEVIINGQVRGLPREMNIIDLLDHLGVRPDGVAVALNGEVVLREEWEKTRIRAGDHVEVVHMVGGGQC
ncbi:MAG: thiamine biosynthesis protein ThiS [Chloroflexota bacterium]